MRVPVATRTWSPYLPHVATPGGAELKVSLPDTAATLLCMSVGVCMCVVCVLLDVELREPLCLARYLWQDCMYTPTVCVVVAKDRHSRNIQPKDMVVLIYAVNFTMLPSHQLNLFIHLSLSFSELRFSRSDDHDDYYFEENEYIRDMKVWYFLHPTLSTLPPKPSV